MGRRWLLLGLDPGKRTGLAFYDAEANGGAGALTCCEALDFWDAVEAVTEAATAPPKSSPAGSRVSPCPPMRSVCIV